VGWVSWPQALMIMHATSMASWVASWVPSWVPSWVHWRQVLGTLLAGLAAGWVCLSLRYLHKGQPFGTRKAAVRAVSVILLTAILATAISVLLPRLPPVSIGLLIPALLCVQRLPKGEREPVTEQPPWYGLITGGVSLLLNWLEDQTAADCLRWAERKVVKEVHGVGDLTMAAEHVQSTLRTLTRNRPGSARLKRELKADYDGVDTAVARALEAANSEEAMKAEYSARHALITMLGRAYAWRCTNITVMPSHQLV
jgi:hypothetical protein